jgi:ABC-type dipeptide/oligopeptide/nickel transport system permease component
VRYWFSKVLLVGVTIFLGVFATVLIANRPAVLGLRVAEPQFEASIERQIERVTRSYIYGGFVLPEGVTTLDELEETLREEAGLNLPFWERHLLWTYKVLTFNWGRLSSFEALPIFGQSRFDFDVNAIILDSFPNTLLLVGVANLIVFLVGIPLSLYLARTMENSWTGWFRSFRLSPPCRAG